jgi:hypothetical protein
MRDVADDRLPAGMHVHVLDRHLLLASRAIPRQGFELCGKRSSELVEGALSAVLPRDVLNVG